MSRVTDLLERWGRMKHTRNQWLDLWQDLADVLHPNAGDFLRSIEPGQKRGMDIYDGSPRIGLRDLTSTIDGLLKPQTSEWFEPYIEDEDVNRRDDVRAFMEAKRRRMWNAIYRVDARFIQRSTETDLSLTTFGHGCLWPQQNARRDGLLFKTFPVGQFAIEENAEGIVDTIAIEEEKTASQWVRQFGEDKVSKQINLAMKDPKQRTTKFTFLQMVMPRQDRDSTKIDSGNMPFASIVIDVKGEHIVVEGGFEDFPPTIPRWDTVPGEVYARSPGMMALPDTQTLQAMGKTLLIGGQRAVDPPMGVLNDSVVSAVRNYPGGITVFDANDTSTQPPVFPFPVSTNIPLGREMQADYRAQVEAAFFKNVFNLPVDGPEMTATEIIARQEEFIRVLGPVFGRQESDYLGKTITRVDGIMTRAGAFADAPEAMDGHEIRFRFQSPIQKARRQMDIAALSFSLERLAPLAEVKPEIMDHIDGDAITRDAPEWAGLPSRWMKAEDQVAQERQDRQQQQQMQELVEGAQPVSEAIKNVAQADKALQPEGDIQPI